ncbi:YggT family protein [Leptotrichia sp. oral taxon 879]|uniref:YggT family protein n=1 Tax=Leptotrichia sp. oral taxon 879 TaxID=1227267 RepID=UPI000428DAA0|nr:YggT family protein [Leptotrichia sp. oral taxon 879]
MDIVIAVILKLFDLYALLILVNILGTWIDPYNQIGLFQWVRKVTEPYLQMFKIIIPIGSMNLDISAMLGLMILELIKEIFVRTVLLGSF